MLATEQLLELSWIDTWHRDMSPYAIHDQRKQQKNQATTQIAELTGLCNLSRASSHRCLPSEPHSGDAAASSFDSCLGTGRCAHTVQLYSLGESTTLDDLDDLGQLAHEASLLESQYVHFGQAELV